MIIHTLKLISVNLLALKQSTTLDALMLPSNGINLMLDGVAGHVKYGNTLEILRIKALS